MFSIFTFIAFKSLDDGIVCTVFTYLCYVFVL